VSRKRRAPRSFRKARVGFKRARRFAKRRAAGLVPTLKKAVPAIAVGAVGFVATRYLTSFLLKEKDQSWMGYLGSAVITALGTALLLKLKKPTLAGSFATGAGIGLALRIASDLAPKQMGALGMGALSPARGSLGALRPATAPGIGALTPRRFVA
jgi:hypothetical protein